LHSHPKGVEVAPLPTKEELNDFYDIYSVLRGLAIRKAAWSSPDNSDTKLRHFF
jgi:hypothetical protein